MGNTNQPQKLEDEENHEVNASGKFDHRKIFWDRDGNLRYGASTRNRDEELISVLMTDNHNDKDVTRLWWIRQWITFTHLKTGKEPGKITMMSLLVADHSVPGGLRPNKNLMAPNADQASEEAPGHYRRVTYDAWCQLEMLYGADGPAIAVRGIPYDDISRWRVFKDFKNIDINLLPEPILPDEPVEEKKGLLGGLFGKKATPAAAKDSESKTGSGDKK